MADKELESIIRKAMPKARIIESRPLAGADPRPAARKGEAVAPEIGRLLDKYYGAADQHRDAPGDDAAVQLTEVELELPEDAKDATSKRLSKRTVLIDRKSKKLLGSSG